LAHLPPMATILITLLLLRHFNFILKFFYVFISLFFRKREFELILKTITGQKTKRKSGALR
jgi:hypothetical protein